MTPVFTMVGLPDAAVRESRERIRARDQQLQLLFSHPFSRRSEPCSGRKHKKRRLEFRITGMAYRNTRRERRSQARRTGRHADLRGVVIGRSCSSDQGRITGWCVRASPRRKSELIVPEENAREAAVVTGLDVYPVATLNQAWWSC